MVSPFQGYSVTIEKLSLQSRAIVKVYGLSFWNSKIAAMKEHLVSINISK